MTNQSAFSLKIRNLNEYYNTISNGQVQTQSLSSDLVNNLRELSNILLLTLKELNGKSLGDDENKYAYTYRKQFYPNLSYQNLFNSLHSLIEIVPMIQFNKLDVGTEVIHALSCLSPFLSDDLLVQLPYNLAMTLSTFPIELQKTIMDHLCNTIIPIAFSYVDSATYPFLFNSISSIITFVIEYSIDQEFCAQLFDACLQYKQNFIQDVLCAIAYGSFKIRLFCTNLLYIYWPYMGLFKNYKNLVIYNHISRLPIFCQSEKCYHKKMPATKVSLDPTLSQFGFNTYPPYYLCNNCHGGIHENLKKFCRSIPKPVESIMANCEHKDCMSKSNLAFTTSYDSLLIAKNDNKPMSYCKACYLIIKNENQEYKFQNSIENIWECDALTKNYLVLSMINLMNNVYRLQANSLSDKIEDKKSHKNGSPSNRFNYDETPNNKRSLSKYGCALAMKLVSPEDIEDIETFGRILSMIFQWFKMNQYVQGDSNGESILNFRSKVLLPWIKIVVEKHFALTVSCLLPYPPEFAKVGGVWTAMSKRSTQIKEEFEKFSCLISYDIITYEVWNYVMPYWIESIINEIDENFLEEMKSQISKLFDEEISTMSFSKEQVYNFISERLNGAQASIQEQALSWLQLLSLLEIKIPFDILMDMLKFGINALYKLELRAQNHNALNQEPAKQYYNDALQFYDSYQTYNSHRGKFALKQLSGQEISQILKEEEEDFIINETDLNLTCCIMQLDTLYKQLTLHKITPHMGMFDPISKDIMLLMNKQLNIPWTRYNMAKNPHEGYLNTFQEQSPTSSGLLSDINSSYCEDFCLWLSIAKDILEYILPKDEIHLQELYFYQLIETKKSVKFNTHKQNECENSSKGPNEGVWVTSEGIYYFKLSNLDVHLQLFLSFLRALNKAPDVDSLYNVLECLKYLIIHGGCLDLALKNNKGFFIYCLEKYLVPNIWRIFSTNFCHLNKVASKIFVHILTNDFGKRLVWDTIERDFKSDEWKHRMQLTSRVVAIIQNLNSNDIHVNCNLFSTIAFAIVCFIQSIEDTNTLVSQKARGYIEFLSENGIKTLMKCLELQFDCVIEDREIVYKMWSLLFACLPFKLKKLCFNWKFFLVRLNALQIESVVGMDDFTNENSLTNTPMPHEVKLARFALIKTKRIRLISASVKKSNTHMDHKDDRTVNTHLLINFLFDFMMNETHDYTDADTKTQNSVLNHLYLMFGYNPMDQKFGLNPRKLRQSSVIAILLEKLAKLMDRNLHLGNQLLPFVLSILKHLPSPHSFHRESNESLRIIDRNNMETPDYSLFLLNPCLLSPWISTLLVILYKYQYNSLGLADSIKYLLRIVLNTLNNSYHECNPNDKQKFVKSVSANFDTQVSVSNDGNETSGNVVTENDETMSSKSHNSENTIKKISTNSSLATNKLDAKNTNLSLSNVSAIGSRKNLTSINGQSQTSLLRLLNMNKSEQHKCLDVTKNSDSKRKKKPSKRRQIFTAFKKSSNSFLDRNFLLNFGGATAALATAAALCTDDTDDSNLSKTANKTTTTVEEYQMESIKFSNERCHICLSVIEKYDKENLAQLILLCSTLVHRECSMAASEILDIIMIALKIASHRNDLSSLYVPCNTTSVARQAIRLILCQLAPNEIFFQLFQSDFKKIELIKTLANCLLDCSEMSSISALRQIINDLNEQNILNMDMCLDILNNVSIYMEYVPIDSQFQQWQLVFQEFEILFKKLEPLMNKSHDYLCLIKIIIYLLKAPGISSNKIILEPFSKVLSFIVKNSYFQLEHLIEISTLCIRNFLKDRDRIYIQKALINEFVQSIQLKANCTDRNLLLLLKYALMDAGGFINIYSEKDKKYDPHQFIQTNASECLKQYTSEIINFIGDIHTITKIKQYLRNKKQFHLQKQDDTLGAQLKAGLAQYLALELTDLNKSAKDRNDNKSIQKYFPWLFNIPSNAQQQGAKEFVECIDHIRILSWILIGSLTHAVLTQNEGIVVSYPIPIFCGHFIGEHVFFILNGFAEHSKTSAIHMSSLFHSFILCQLWTLYCEEIYTNASDNSQEALNSIMEFWTKITPGILQLLSQNKILTLEVACFKGSTQFK